MAKHNTWGMYPTNSYVLSLVLLGLPLSLWESLLFTTILYFMVGFANDAGAFFLFVSIVFMCAFSTSGIFRFLAFIAPNQEVC